MAHLASGIRRISSPDGGIVLDLRSGSMFRLNPVGSRILDLLDEGHSAGEIVQRLSAEFHISLDVSQTDVREFLDSLKVRGLCDSSAPAA
jgi:hypothetical protein